MMKYKNRVEKCPVTKFKPWQLQLGDIILSANNLPVSKFIRRMNFSPVSHSILYVGNGNIIEAIVQYPTKVIIRSLKDAINYWKYAVVLRYPNLTLDQSLTIAQFAIDNIHKKYDYVGAILSLVGGCSGIRNRYFCSELIIDAYATARIFLVDRGECKDLNILWKSPELICMGTLQDWRN